MSLALRYSVTVNDLINDFLQRSLVPLEETIASAQLMTTKQRVPDDGTLSIADASRAEPATPVCFAAPHAFGFGEDGNFALNSAWGAHRYPHDGAIVVEIGRAGGLTVNVSETQFRKMLLDVVDTSDGSDWYDEPVYVRVDGRSLTPEAGVEALEIVRLSKSVGGLSRQPGGYGFMGASWVGPHSVNRDYPFVSTSGGAVEHPVLVVGGDDLTLHVFVPRSSAPEMSRTEQGFAAEVKVVDQVPAVDEAIRSLAPRALRQREAALYGL